MLKLKLTTLDGLPAEVAKEYKKDGDVYILDTDVQFEDVTPIKNALAQEKQARKDATQKVQVLEGQIVDLQARSKPAGEIEEAYKTKLEKAGKDHDDATKALRDQINTLLVDNEAQRIAAEVSESPELLLPFIRKRLVVAEEDGKFLTRVLTADGKASALSLNELKTEIVADKQFAPLITASKASGGGANGNKMPPGGKAFKDMTESEKVTLYRANPAQFDRMAAEAGHPVKKPA
jgi:hypothetical protein